VIDAFALVATALRGADFFNERVELLFKPIEPRCFATLFAATPHWTATLWATMPSKPRTVFVPTTATSLLGNVTMLAAMPAMISAASKSVPMSTTTMPAATMHLAMPASGESATAHVAMMSVVSAVMAHR
jgi:hypothetical protein